MPFGEYKDFADCVKSNQDKSNPEAYCAAVHKKITGEWPSQKNRIEALKEKYKPIGFAFEIETDYKNGVPPDKIARRYGLDEDEVIDFINDNNDFMTKKRRIEKLQNIKNMFIKENSNIKSIIKSDIYQLENGLQYVDMAIDSLKRVGSLNSYKFNEFKTLERISDILENSIKIAERELNETESIKALKEKLMKNETLQENRMEALKDGSRVKIVGQVRNQGKIGTVVELSSPGADIYLVDVNGKMSYYHGSDLKLVRESLIIQKNKKLKESKFKIGDEVTIKVAGNKKGIVKKVSGDVVTVSYDSNGITRVDTYYDQDLIKESLSNKSFKEWKDKNGKAILGGNKVKTPDGKIGYAYQIDNGEVRVTSSPQTGLIGWYKTNELEVKEGAPQRIEVQDDSIFQRIEKIKSSLKR